MKVIECSSADVGKIQDGSRFAIFFTPNRHSDLWSFGSLWLGRDIYSGTELRRFDVPGLSYALTQRITEKPRFYGFHATLKPPFHLKEGATIDELIGHVQAFTQRIASINLARLHIDQLSGFLALRPIETNSALNDLAAMCVEEFDPYRREASEQEIQRRKAIGLNAAQESHLMRWGYPYVMDQFRFHFTLTEQLDTELAFRIRGVLEERLAQLNTSADITALSLCFQADRDQPFQVLREFQLAG